MEALLSGGAIAGSVGPDLKRPIPENEEPRAAVSGPGHLPGP